MPNQTGTQPASTEVLIVGGGPAGLAAAIALGQRGIGCTVVEAGAIAIDKACGEGLMPDSLGSLARLGVNLDPEDGNPFLGIRFQNARHHVDGHFPNGAGIGVRRPRLHTLLAERAAQTGAHLLWNSRVQLPDTSAGAHASPSALGTAMVNGQPLTFRWLIGADGQASSVRRWAGLDRARSQSIRYGFRTHYRAAPWSDFVEIHWGPGGQLYLTPVAPDCVCVVYLSRDPHRTSADSRANALADFPEVARRLRGAEIVSRQRGAVSASRKLHRVATESVALIGDASGSPDSITGEGLALCFRQAVALAQSIQSGSLAPYRRAHRSIGRLPHAMGSLMLILDRWPTLEMRALRAFATTPIFFQDLLRAHMGDKSLASVVLCRGPRFALDLLTGHPFRSHAAQLR